MRRKRRTQPKSGPARRSVFRLIFSPLRHRGVWMVLLISLPVLLGLGGAAVALTRLDEHVDARLRADVSRVTFSFVDLPDEMAALARPDLDAAVAPLVARAWTEASLCRDAAERLASVGWVAKVTSVRRRGGGILEVRCDFRRPVALVEHSGAFYLVSAKGTRLPGVYLNDPPWKVVRGVLAGPPPAGSSWPGPDVFAGLRLLEVLRGEPYGAQIAAVNVDNYGGRSNPRESHLRLETDATGGSIRWGSAVGEEVEENSVAQKLALLRENFRRTGRAGGGHRLIDVSTYPDRFAIPE